MGEDEQAVHAAVRRRRVVVTGDEVRDRLAELLGGRRVAPSVALYVSSSRTVLQQVGRAGVLSGLLDAGVKPVADTCTYFGPVLEGCDGAVMTDSAKWARYAPGNLGARVVLGSLEDCVRSAVEGRVSRDERLWSGEDEAR